MQSLSQILLRKLNLGLWHQVEKRNLHDFYRDSCLRRYKLWMSEYWLRIWPPKKITITGVNYSPIYVEREMALYCFNLTVWLMRKVMMNISMNNQVTCYINTTIYYSVTTVSNTTTHQQVSSTGFSFIQRPTSIRKRGDFCDLVGTGFP